MSSFPAPALAALVSQRFGVIAVAILICVVIFELIRRKHLMERYAILWFCLGISTLVLAAWKGLLTTLAHAGGIYYPPAALFAVAFLFVLALLLHFSIVLSRLSDQNKILAQRLALLQQRLDEKESAEGEENKEQQPVHESSRAS
ncbi:MAG TPA: DUF2304 domain-containing protein [Solirubrobacterales bacterium]|nr:DUF2304 domain-containing protein [Solirubrobacterales bacterium]